MKYRSSTEIIDAMLRSIGSVATKTHIMYSAFMSYSQLKEYLVMLEQRYLIELDVSSGLYTLTKKGIQFMNAYDQIHKLVPNAVERNTSFKEIPGREAFTY